MIDYIVRDISHYCNVRLGKCSQIISAPVSYYDFTFVLNGNMTYVCDGKVCNLKKNDAVFIKPGSIRERKEGNEPVHYVSFNFTANESHDLDFDTHIKDCITRDIRKLISIYSPSHLTRNFYSREKVANLLNYILLELSDIKNTDTHNEHIMRVIRYVDEHITENITLKVISNEMNLSKEYLSAIFKKEMNTTLTDYINQRKIRLAKDMISQGSMELNDIAEYVGYKNYNYFSRLFKRYYDITPAGLKRKNK